MCAFYRLAGMTLVILQSLRSHTTEQLSEVVECVSMTT